MKTDGNDQILIVGAGIAGLTAAYELALHGKRVTIIEARDRIGGRIHTVRPSNSDLPIELGAEFIHGRPPELLELLQKASQRICDCNPTHWFADNGIFRHEPDYYEMLNETIAKMCEFSQSRSEDCSFATFAEAALSTNVSSESSIDLARKFVEGYNAANADSISAKFLTEGELASRTIFIEDQFRSVDGLSRLTEYLAGVIHSQGGAIRLGLQVETIKWSRGTVSIEASGETFQGAAAIITVPIEILKLAPRTSGALNFEPDIADKREAARKIVMGDVRKVVLHFNKRFWEYPTTITTDCTAPGDFLEFGYIHAASEPIPFWWSQYPMRSPILIGWAGGPQAELLPTNETDLRKQSLLTLSRIFHIDVVELENMLLGFYTHAWHSDPYSRGAYSYETVGAGDAASRLAQSIDDTLFFAGEATETNGFSGTIYGALLTGSRAAREVFKAGHESIV